MLPGSRAEKVTVINVTCHIKNSLGLVAKSAGILPLKFLSSKILI